MNAHAIARPFDEGSQVQTQSYSNGNPLASLTNARAAEKVASVIAQMQIAKAFPRDMHLVQRKVESEFSRPSLAEHAIYAYPKGGTTVTGPSIRSAESIARCMGNIKSGYEELECNLDQHFSRVMAYAVDMENNVPVERVFRVEHVLQTKKGPKILTDPREIYEIIANQSMRRVRACILELVPADLVDFAMSTVNATMESNVNLGNPHIIEKMLEAFKKFGVNKQMIEARIGRNISAILPQQYTDLQHIFASLRDGVGSVESFFDISLSDAAQVAQKAVEEQAQQKAQPKQADERREPSGSAVVVNANLDDDSDEETISDEDVEALDAIWAKGGQN